MERFFRDLSQDIVLPGSFASVQELVAAIWEYLAQRNLQPQRFSLPEEKACSRTRTLDRRQSTVCAQGCVHVFGMQHIILINRSPIPPGI